MRVLPTLIIGSSGRRWGDGQRMRDLYDLPQGKASGIFTALISLPREQKTIGAWNLLNVLEGLEGFSMGLFTRVLGWEPEEVQLLLADVRKDLQDPKIHAQVDL